MGAPVLAPVPPPTPATRSTIAPLQQPRRYLAAKPNRSKTTSTYRLPSVGSVGDSYDNALAETVIGLFKTEVIRRRGP